MRKYHNFDAKLFKNQQEQQQQLIRKLEQNIAIEQIVRKLKSSSIPRSKLHRFEMLLKDIQSNRFHVYEIINRMNLILSDPNRTAKQISDCLKSMVREGYISEEQFQSLNKKDKDLYLEKWSEK